LDENKYEILEKAEALLLLTEWEEVKSSNFEQERSLLTKPLLFSGKNQFDSGMMQKLGFEYVRIRLE
jgi:UDPglucose 6-dehydrogenase